MDKIDTILEELPVEDIVLIICNGALSIIMLRILLVI